MTADCAMPEGGNFSALDLATHLGECEPCRKKLADVSSQSDAIARLGASPVGERIAVERMLGAAVAEGQRKLGDLVYEMGRACLREAQVGADRELTPLYPHPPESVSKLVGEVDRIERRLKTGSVGSNPEFPRSAPSKERALEVALACVGILAVVEGESPNKRYLEGIALFLDGRTRLAVEQMESLLSDEEISERRWLSVAWALSAMLLRTEQPEQAIVVANRGLERFPADRILLFNLATAHSALGNNIAFDETCRRFSASQEPVSDAAWWARAIESQLPVFAAELGRSVASVQALLTVPSVRSGAES